MAGKVTPQQGKSAREQLAALELVLNFVEHPHDYVTAIQAYHERDDLIIRGRALTTTEVELALRFNLSFLTPAKVWKLRGERTELLQFLNAHEASTSTQDNPKPVP